MTLLREPLFRGVRDIDAILVTDSHAERVAGLWVAGARLFRIGEHDLVLRFPQPISWRCDAGSATALLARDGRLIALPLDDDALAACPQGDVIRLRHGGLVIGHPRLAPVNSLFDVSDWHVAKPLPPTFGQVPAERRPPPAEPSLAVPPAAFDTRARLGGQAEPTPREQRQLRRLQQPAAPPAGSSRLDRPIGFDWLNRRRTQHYLDDLTRLFAAGDIEAALRRAIPFGGESGPRARRTPTPRNDLRLNPYRAAPTSSVELDPGLRAELAQRYQSAFARLEVEGRILDAAFVLADLLDRVPEACSFLERHGELVLAAQLAEARSNDPGEVVRLWWRAGDRQRAVAIARRHSCFAPAVTRLERTGNKDEANELRRTWMSHLLEAGDIVTAYDVGAPLADPAATAMLERLVEIGIERGGPLRARMLARHLRSRSERPHPALATLLTDGDTRRERDVLARELAREQASVDHPDVVRTLLRQLIADGADVDKSTLDRLVTLTADPVLRTDLPPTAQRRTPTRVAGEALWIEIDAHDRGQVPATDARVLTDGRLLVALGDLGLQVINKRGRIETKIDVPTHTVVTSDNGLRALALRPLDADVVAINVVSLSEQRYRSIGELPAGTWADTFDGAQWFVARNSQLWLLDVLADKPTVLWRAEDHREPIFAISRFTNSLVVASLARTAMAGSVPIVRRYALPGLSVISTEHVHDAPEGTILPDGGVLPGAVAGDATFSCRLEPGENTATAVVTRSGAPTPVVIAQLHGTTEPTVRLDERTLVISDGYGRIEVVDLDTNEQRSYRTKT